MKTRARERGHSSRLRGSESRCMAAMAVLGPRRKHAAVGTRTPVRKQTMQTTEKIKTHNLGYPRIGESRELKRATEAFWNGTITEAELLAKAAELRRHHWQKQQALGIDLIPSKDRSVTEVAIKSIMLYGPDIAKKAVPAQPLSSAGISEPTRKPERLADMDSRPGWGTILPGMPVARHRPASDLK